MEFRILGSLEASVDGRALPLGPAKQRALLAVLLIRANEVVTADTLIEALWPERPPETAAKALQVYVSGLRRTLRPGAGDRVHTRPLGYALVLAPDELDRDRFERLLEQGKAARTAGEAALARETLAEALDLWRGPALADFRYEPFAQAEIGRLEELRLAALEERIEADLALGRHAELVGELEALIAEHPLRERLRGQLMLALYRSGRQGEALAVYQEGRRALVEELGIEPSPSLRELEAAVLRQDAALASPAQPSAALGAPDAATEAREAPAVRKVVSVVVSEVAGATGLHERLDPEALRRVTARYFDVASEVVDRHEGTIDRLTGEALVAVFGIPRLHEDDALRAVRAAVELRDALAPLDEELHRAWGARLGLRIGVSTGEVIAGSRPNALSGDVVNVAAKLQEEAAPGGILLGDATRRLVEDAVVVEAAEPVRMRGRRDAVAAFELQAVLPEGPAYRRRAESPLVGREEERALLTGAFERAVAETASRLFTVLGPAGVGKSRLAAEFVASLGDRATMLVGRCLPYGEGVTFWPVRELLEQAAGLNGEDPVDRALAKLGELVEGEEDARSIREPLGQLFGFVEATATSEETFWAVRRVFELLARPRPLVVVFEDVHWAEPTLLDLVEYVLDWWHGVSLLVVCLARSDFLEQRPSWSRRKDADVLALEPLSEEESQELLDGVLGEASLSDVTRAAIIEAAEGNPLFLEQMLAMVAEQGLSADGGLTIPPTIQGLLASRLDALGEGERAVIDRAAVMGRTFSWEAVRELLPEEARPRVGERLLALARKELVSPERLGAEREHAFRFRHLLIRDAAYAALPKEARAGFHERFADWLEGKPGEYEEIVGYHLEQAVRYRSELGLLDERGREVAARAGDHLGAAGRRALARGDVPAAVKLLRRAAALFETEGSPRPDLLVDLSVALREDGDLAGADVVLGEAIEISAKRGDARLRARAEIERSSLRALVDPTVSSDVLREAAERAIPIFEASGDDRGMARAWRHVAQAYWHWCRCAPMEDALERALVHAERAGDEREVSEVLNLLVRAIVLGPKPVEEAIGRCDELRRHAEGDLVLQAWIDALLAVLEAMRGDIARARRLYRASEETLRDRGLNMTRAGVHFYAGIVELIAGQADAAERELQAAYDLLERMGERYQLSTTAALLARALDAQGRYAEAERLAGVSEEFAAEDDLASQVMWRQTLGKLLARRGEGERAETFLRDAVALVQTSDFLNVHADTVSDLAEVLRLLDRGDDARPVLDEAIRLYETKGNLVSAATTRALLAEGLGGGG